MRKLLTIFLVLILATGLAGAVIKTLPKWMPATGFSTKAIQADTITADTITATTNVTNGVFGDDLALDSGYDFTCNAGSGKFDWRLGTGDFNTTNGTNRLNGPVEAASTITSTGIGVFGGVNVTLLNINASSAVASVAALEMDAYTNETAINSSISSAVSDIATNATKADNALAWLALNETRIDGLELPIASFDYTASSVDQGIYTAKGAWTLTGVRMTPRVVGSDGSAVTVMVKLCDSGEAPTSGDNMLTGTLDLKGTADTPQSGTLSGTVAIANGKVVALDFNGTLTSAVGHIDLFGVRA